MRTYIYDSGRAKLTEQDGQGWLLNFTGFKLSSDPAIVFNKAVNTLPSTVYTGSVSEMKYVPMNANQVMLQIIVARSVIQKTIGAVQLLVNNVPFSLSLVKTGSFIKLQQDVGETVGSRYMYQIMIEIPQLLQRIAFTNLQTNLARFKSFATNAVMTRWPWEESHDVLMINNFLAMNKPVPVINAWNDYWGCPLMAVSGDGNTAPNDTMFFKITGGVVGDGHKYASQP